MYILSKKNFYCSQLTLPKSTSHYLYSSPCNEFAKKYLVFEHFDCLSSPLNALSEVLFKIQSQSIYCIPYSFSFLLTTCSKLLPRVFVFLSKDGCCVCAHKIIVTPSYLFSLIRSNLSFHTNNVHSTRLNYSFPALLITSLNIKLPSSIRQPITITHFLSTPFYPTPPSNTLLDPPSSSTFNYSFSSTHLSFYFQFPLQSLLLVLAITTTCPSNLTVSFSHLPITRRLLSRLNPLNLQLREVVTAWCTKD